MQQQQSNFEELNSVVRRDHNGIGGIGEELESGGPTSHRWPREQTLALLRIRSEMDSAFRDASPKGPLWEQVSSKLAELGYKRSAKKCREKFENVQKYYKRTKDGRAGHKDGKMYRFFAELETLNLATSTANHHTSYGSVPSTAQTMPMAAASPVSSSGFVMSPIGAGPQLCPIQPTPISVVAPAPAQNTEAGPMGFTTSSSESEESDSEMTDASGNQEKGGRKRKMMDLFEGLVKQVMARQEEMQKLFLETLEKREHERMAREDAWRRQETARLNREHEILSHERAMATSRDAALVSFIQRINMQSVQPAAAIPPALNMAITLMSPKPNQQKQQVPRSPPKQQQQQQLPSEQLLTTPQIPPQDQQGKQERALQVVPHQAYSSPAPVESREIVMSMVTEATPSSRWPKVEVHALIKIRTELETRYQENGPKGPMWEEISAGMKRMGYNRSAKRCKEKWENINKYFKRVKESSKRRPEDSKTCPYFHELDALYRKKLLAGNGSTAAPAPAPALAPAPAPALAPVVSSTSKSESESRNEDSGGTHDVVGKTVQLGQTTTENINGS